MTLETLAPQSPWAPVLVAVGVVGMAILITISIRARIARRNAARPAPRQVIEEIKGRQAAAGGMAFPAAAVETAHRLGAQLDNKARMLEKLIAEADERLARLDAVIAEPADTAPRRAPSPDPLTRAVYEQADKGLTTVEIARQLDEQIGKVELILALRG